MGKGLQIAVSVMACVAPISVSAAQRGAPQRGAPPSPAAASAAPARNFFVVIGCVTRDQQAAPGRGGAETFIITDMRGAPPARYRLDVDAEQLRWHVGHTLEVAGAIAPASAGRGAAAVPALKVQSLTYISTTCQK